MKIPILPEKCSIPENGYINPYHKFLHGYISWFLQTTLCKPGKLFTTNSALQTRKTYGLRAWKPHNSR